MNLSTAIFLMDDAGARAMRVEYDPEIKANNNPSKAFKTLDPTIKKDDLVIVQTNTRHGFTVAKVTEADVRIDFSSLEQFGWIVGKVDKSTFDAMVAQEALLLDRIADVEQNRRKKELADAMGLAKVDMSGLSIVRGAAALPAPAAPPAMEEVKEAPTA